MRLVNRCLFFTLLFITSCALFAQWPPVSSQAHLYFPHLATGGPASAQWQTRFTFVNPNNAQSTIILSLYTDSGTPLVLTFGSVTSSAVVFTVPANGTYVLLGQADSASITGWAYADASLPVQGNVAFASFRMDRQSWRLPPNPRSRWVAIDP